MDFCWMDNGKEDSANEDGDKSVLAAEEDVAERAALLRRLGYDQADAVHRCMGNIAWAFSVHRKPSITPARIRKIVASVYKPAS